MFKQTFHLCAGMLNQLYKVKMEPAGAGMRQPVVLIQTKEIRINFVYSIGLYGTNANLIPNH